MYRIPRTWAIILGAMLSCPGGVRGQESAGRDIRSGAGADSIEWTVTDGESGSKLHTIRSELDGCSVTYWIKLYSQFIGEPILVESSEVDTDRVTVEPRVDLTRDEMSAYMVDVLGRAGFRVADVGGLKCVWKSTSALRERPRWRVTHVTLPTLPIRDSRERVSSFVVTRRADSMGVLGEDAGGELVETIRLSPPPSEIAIYRITGSATDVFKRCDALLRADGRKLTTNDADKSSRRAPIGFSSVVDETAVDASQGVVLQFDEAVGTSLADFARFVENLAEKRVRVDSEETATLRIFGKVAISKDRAEAFAKACWMAKGLRVVGSDELRVVPATSNALVEATTGNAVSIADLGNDLFAPVRVRIETTLELETATNIARGFLFEPWERVEVGDDAASVVVVTDEQTAFSLSTILRDVERQIAGE